MPKVITIAAAVVSAMIDAETRKAIAAEINVSPESVTLPEDFSADTQPDGSINVSLPSLSVNFETDGAIAEEAPAPKGKPGRKPKAAGSTPTKPRAAKGTKVYNADAKGRPPAWFVALSDKDKDAYRKMNATQRKAYMVKAGHLSK